MSSTSDKHPAGTGHVYAQEGLVVPEGEAQQVIVGRSDVHPAGSGRALVATVGVSLGACVKLQTLLDAGAVQLPTRNTAADWPNGTWFVYNDTLDPDRDANGEGAVYQIYLGTYEHIWTGMPGGVALAGVTYAIFFRTWGTWHVHTRFGVPGADEAFLLPAGTPLTGPTVPWTGAPVDYDYSNIPNLQVTFIDPACYPISLFGPQTDEQAWVYLWTPTQNWAWSMVSFSAFRVGTGYHGISGPRIYQVPGGLGCTVTPYYWYPNTVVWSEEPVVYPNASVVGGNGHPGNGAALTDGSYLTFGTEDYPSGFAVAYYPQPFQAVGIYMRQMHAGFSSGIGGTGKYSAKAWHVEAWPYTLLGDAPPVHLNWLALGAVTIFSASAYAEEYSAALIDAPLAKAYKIVMDEDAYTGGDPRNQWMISEFQLTGDGLHGECGATAAGVELVHIRGSGHVPSHSAEPAV